MTNSGTPDNKRLLLVMDGNAMVHRAWHAIRQPLTVSRTGEDVHGAYGFVNTFLRELAHFNPTHCAISFDMSGPTFRHKEYNEYKAHRPATPTELLAQFQHVREVIDAFSVPIFEHQGYEADDVIGTICHLAKESNLETVVLTGDTDELQLVSDNVQVLLTYGAQKRTLYDIEAVKERYGGLGPEAVADLKALVGDPSDNIPGVPGIGTKTAIRLLTEYSSIEGIYSRINELEPGRIRENLQKNQDQALRSKFLTTIVTDVPLDLNLEATQFWKYDRSNVIERLSELEFFSLVNRVPNPQTQPTVTGQSELVLSTSVTETSVEVVDNLDRLESLISELSSASEFAFFTLSVGSDPMTAKLVGLAFCTTENSGWYLPVGHDVDAHLNNIDILPRLKPLLEDEDVPKITYNANFSMSLMARNGINIAGVAFDSILAAHTSGRQAIDLNSLALDCLHIEIEPLESITGKGRTRKTIAEVSPKEAASLAVAMVNVSQRIQPVLNSEIDEKRCASVFRNVELPLVPVLVRMQLNGVAIDVPLLDQMSSELDERISLIKSELFGEIGHEFNINSSQQLSDVLFKEIGLPTTKRTLKGYSTNASALEHLKAQLDQGDIVNVDPSARNILDNVLEYRQISKIKSTYVDALPGLVNVETGRIHTTYNQTGSATGRVSSDHPNVQNIPVRTKLGRRVRHAFIAEDASEWTLLAVDYSQIELRILAHLSGDPRLIEDFHTGQDIHSATAASVYDVPIDQVTSAMRRIAKIMNFGVIYGLSPFGINQQTGLSPEDGKSFINSYFGNYPLIRLYIDSAKTQVRKNGYVQTILGRRRYIPEITSSNFHVRASGERMAINMPIQGTAAEAIKIAMLRIQQRIDSLHMKTMMIVQVHDELIFEVPTNEIAQLQKLVLEIMPNVLDLQIPLDVEIKTGTSWGDME